MTSKTPLAAIVMAAGLGTRMRSSVPKHLHPLLGKRVVDWVLDAARQTGVERLVVVVAPGYEDAFEGVEVAVQEQPLGTGDSVRSAAPRLQDFEGRVLVLDAAAPLLTADHFAALLEEHDRQHADVTILSFESEGLPYGRIVRDENGAVEAIVEDRDATEDEKAIRELNSSIYVFESAPLWVALSQLDSHNAQGELYLTDTVKNIVGGGGLAAAWICPDPEATLGINTRAELAVAAGVLRDRINERHMLAGVTIVDPRSTWIEAGVELGEDVVIHPFTVVGGRTRVASGAVLGPHVAIADAVIGEAATVGPFCYVRPGTVLEAGAKAGTFVEIKNSRIGARTKVPHLSYVGDADIGEDTNIAAANVTANFSHKPGAGKGRTTIGSNVRTGVDNTFVAPVEVGDEAWIYPGTVITEDVPPAALAGFPPRQVNKEGYVSEERRVRRERDD
jgi:bifunctional UDP-N-acetylglucosamine pyrophosphorylase/glucosamine-1-phosphate N-acetyltransferase